MIKPILISFFLTLLASANISAEATSGVSIDWPPYMDPNHQRGGIVVEIAREALKTQGVKLDHQFLTWTNAAESVKEGELDLLTGIWITEERKQEYSFSDTVLFNKIVFIKKKGDRFKYKDLASLSGKKVGTVSGYAYTPEFDKAKNFEHIESKTLVESIKKLVDGKVDLTLDDEISIKSLLSNQAPELLEKIEFVEEPLVSVGLHMASGMKHAQHSEIIRTLNKGLAEIKANGQYDKIFLSYGIQKR